MADSFQFPGMENQPQQRLIILPLQKQRQILPKPAGFNEQDESTLKNRLTFFDMVKLIRDFCLQKLSRARSSDFAGIPPSQLKDLKKSARENIKNIVSTCCCCLISLFLSKRLNSPEVRSFVVYLVF